MAPEKKTIMAFDIGVHHFAWAKGFRDDDRLVVVAMDCHDFGKTGSLCEFYPRLSSYLKTLDYQGVETVLIEQQMNRMNIRAAKIAVFVHAFFLLLFPNIRVIEYPAFHKTRKFGIRGLSKPERKKWSVRHVSETILVEDPVALDWLETFAKKDDICDCVMMIQSYFM